MDFNSKLLRDIEQLEISLKQLQGQEMEMDENALIYVQPLKNALKRQIADLIKLYEGLNEFN